MRTGRDASPGAAPEDGTGGTEDVAPRPASVGGQLRWSGPDGIGGELRWSAPGAARDVPATPAARGPAAHTDPGPVAPAATAGPDGSPAGAADPAGSGSAGGRRVRPRHRAAAGRRRASQYSLAQPTGPHVRLGIGWAAVTLSVLLLGPVWIAVWLAVVAALAAGSAARSWGTPVALQRKPHTRRLLVQPPVPVSAALSAVVVLGSLAGATAVSVTSVLVTCALLAGATFGPLGQPGPLRRVLIVLAPGLAGASLVLVRAHGLPEALVLAGMVTVYDSSAYLIGTGAPNRWEGLFAGVASIGALTLFVAAVLVPPFTGSSPWLLGTAAAVLTPAGPLVARWLVGDPSARVPALGRLDSLVLLGPVWLAATGALLH